MSLPAQCFFSFDAPQGACTHPTTGSVRAARRPSICEPCQYETLHAQNVALACMIEAMAQAAIAVDHVV